MRIKEELVLIINEIFEIELSSNDYTTDLLCLGLKDVEIVYLITEIHNRFNIAFDVFLNTDEYKYSLESLGSIMGNYMQYEKQNN